MDRRQFVAGASVGAAATVSVYPKPAIAQGARELKMVTIWPKGLPGLQSGADRVAQSITALSGGRLQVKVFPAGQLVGAMESFDAVSSGLADLYYASEITGILFTASTSFANPAVPSSSKIVKTSPKVATGPASPSCQLPVINLHKGFQGFSAFVGSGQYPRNPCNDISCWSQNRRAVTVLDSSS
jgi:hypothetical protein